MLFLKILKQDLCKHSKSLNNLEKNTLSSSKTKIMIINPDKEDNNIEWKIGTLSIPTANIYKYLGQLTEKKSSLKLHIQSEKQSSSLET